MQLFKCHLIGIFFFALLISDVTAEPIGSRIVQPTTYKSPNGDYSLFVYPTDKHGKGDAVYRFEHKGQQVWSRKKQFTLQGVEVTDRGFVIGTAHDGYCHLVIWDAAGGIKLDEWFEQHRQVHSDNEPYVEQILVSEEHDFVTFRLHGHNRRDGKWIGSIMYAEVWSVYRISTGELLHEFKAIEQYAKLDDRWYTIDAQIIPGTPLILVHWYYRALHGNKEERSSQFSVVDIAGQPVWSLRMDNDYIHVVMPRYGPRKKPDSLYSNDPAIIATHESNQFRIRRFTNDKVLTFSVKKKAAGKWSIREENQSAYEPEKVSTHKVMYDGELKYLGELELGQTKNDDSPTGQDSDLAGFTVDRLGRYCAASKSTGITTVFNKDGTISHRLVPESADYKLPLHQIGIHIASDDSVYVNDWLSNRYIRFKPDGSRDKKITFEPGFISWIFLPQSGNRLGINRDFDLVVVDANGQIKRTMKKRPNGKWFYNPHFAASPVGEIATLSRDAADGTTSYTLDRFNSNGDPVDSIVIPSSTSGFSSVIHTGQKILLVDEKEIVIVTLNDKSITRWRMSELSLARSRGKGFVNAQTGELLLYNDISQSVHRFQLPTN